MVAQRPLLFLPAPTRSRPAAGNPPRESMRPVDRGRQALRIGPIFERLSRVLPNPAALAELRADPSAIVPERALVFEVASDMADFYTALRGVDGLEFLGEEEGEFPVDQDITPLQPRIRQPQTAIASRIYFTMPDSRALAEIVGLWGIYQEGNALPRGKAAWKHVFAHLADIRPWGPQDRLTEEVKNVWRQSIEDNPEEDLRFETEFWYRTGEAARVQSEQRLLALVEQRGGSILDSVSIPAIRYHAALVSLPRDSVQALLDNPRDDLCTLDEVMVLLPQSMIDAPADEDINETEDAQEIFALPQLSGPVAALIDGHPMANHSLLAGRLTIDDPDDFDAVYARASDRVHGTNMASLIIHGDLNAHPRSQAIGSRLYVRPVLVPENPAVPNSRERMPSDRLGLDLMWRAFRRMFEEENGEAAAAPNVVLVNLSLGDNVRRFSHVMSPWARLIDHLSWTYNLLVLVSAGNISDSLPLPGVARWVDFERLLPAEREDLLIGQILSNRAHRRLLAPAEALNALTVGALHSDFVPPAGAAALAIDPYELRTLPNVSSALGLGFRKAIKPELLFPGGREHVRSFNNHAPISVVPDTRPGRFFGIGAAAPGAGGSLLATKNTWGTSTATALASHSAIRILESLLELPVGADDPRIPPSHYSVLIKSLLVHSSRWDSSVADRIEALALAGGIDYWEHRRDEVSRLLGFGAANIQDVLDCTENRATLIFWGALRAGETDKFQIPLPTELDGVAGFRSVTATIGWLTPITLQHRMYRMARLEVVPGGDRGLSLGVQNSRTQPSHNAHDRGTVFHNRWEGEQAADFVDGGYLLLDVVCKATAGQLDDAIPYGICVSLEVGETVNVPVYERVRELVRQQVAVRV